MLHGKDENWSIFTIACQSGCLPIDWEANQQRNNDPSCGTSLDEQDSLS